MNLNKLHLLMLQNGYHHLSGFTNSQCLDLVFSKGYNGRGDSFSLNIELLRDVCYVCHYKQNNAPNPPIISEIKDVTFDDMIKFIENKLNSTFKEDL